MTLRGNWVSACVPLNFKSKRACAYLRTHCSAILPDRMWHPQMRWTPWNLVMDSSNDIEQRAAGWLARRDGGTWTQSDQVELDRWLEESTAHTVAFLRLETAWNRADRYKALGAGFARGKIPSPEEFNLSLFFGDSKR